MAYVIGSMTRDELTKLVQLGWEPEDPPASLVPDFGSGRERGQIFVQFWVDSSVLDVMTGPDWETTQGFTSAEAQVLVDEFLDETGQRDFVE